MQNSKNIQQAMDICQVEFSGVIQNVCENISADVKFDDWLAYLTLNVCSTAHHNEYADSHQN